MENTLLIGLSRLTTLERQIDVISNNVANVNTNGFKADKSLFQEYLMPRAHADNFMGRDRQLSYVMDRATWRDNGQGSLEQTGNPLDVAIEGKGFFVVNGPKGPLYTRNGNLKILASGELASGDGYTMRSTAGSTISVAPNKLINITREGNIQQDGQTLGQLDVVDFKSTDSLQKAGSATFKNTNPNNPPVAASNVDVQQGKIEGSNVPVAYSAMRLVGIMRQFEMLQKAIGISSDMDTKSVQEVARVTA